MKFKVGDWVYVDELLGRLLPGWAYKVTAVEDPPLKKIQVFLPNHNCASGWVYSLDKVHHLVEQSTPEDWEAMVG